MARAGKGFKYWTLIPDVQIPNKTWNFRMFCTSSSRGLVLARNPHLFVLKLLVPHARLNIRVGPPKAELFLWTFFFNHDGESNLSGRYPAANQNIFLTVEKKKGTVVESVSFSSVCRLWKSEGRRQKMRSLHLQAVWNFWHRKTTHSTYTCSGTWKQHVFPRNCSDSTGNHFTAHPSATVSDPKRGDL